MSKKKKTRKEKIKQGPQKGQSRYALKQATKARRARLLELPIGTPLPVIIQAEEDAAYSDL